MTTLSTHDFTAIGAGVNPAGAWNNSLGGSIARAFSQRSAGQTFVGAPSGGGVTASSPTTNGHVGGLSFQAPRWGRMEVSVDQSGGNGNTYGLHVWSNGAQNQGSVAERGRITNAAIELRHFLSGNVLIGSDTYARSSANIWLHFSADPRYGLEFTVKDAANSATLRSYARPVPGATGGIAGPAASGDWWSFGFQDSSANQVAKFMAVRLDDGQGGGTLPVITGASSTKTGRNTANINLSIANAAGGEIWYVLTPTNVAPADFDAMVLAPLLNNYQAVAANGAQTIGLAGLTAGTTYYVWVLGRNATRDRGAIVSAGSFTTDAPAATPAGSSATYVQGSDVILTFTSTGGPVVSATASLPVGSPANGAVAQGPMAMVYDAVDWPGVWSAKFTNVPAGDYGTPAVLASNSDFSSVSIPGATAFFIDGPTGEPEAPSTGTPATAPGATWPAAAAFLAGAASGTSNALAAGVVLSAAATWLSGGASGGSASTAPGRTLVVAVAFLPGAAIGVSSATASGTTWPAAAAFLAGEAVTGTEAAGALWECAAAFLAGAPEVERDDQASGASWECAATFLPGEASKNLELTPSATRIVKYQRKRRAVTYWN